MEEESKEDNNVEDEDYDSEVYEVETILKKRINKETGGAEYYIKWLGYDDDWNEWIPEENCGCEDVIKAFEEQEAEKKRKKKKEPKITPKTPAARKKTSKEEDTNTPKTRGRKRKTETPVADSAEGEDASCLAQSEAASTPPNNVLEESTPPPKRPKTLAKNAESKAASKPKPLSKPKPVKSARLTASKLKSDATAPPVSQETPGRAKPKQSGPSRRASQPTGVELKNAKKESLPSKHFEKTPTEMHRSSEKYATSSPSTPPTKGEPLHNAIQKMVVPKKNVSTPELKAPKAEDRKRESDVKDKGRKRVGPVEMEQERKHARAAAASREDEEKRRHLKAAATSAKAGEGVKEKAQSEKEHALALRRETTFLEQKEALAQQPGMTVAQREHSTRLISADCATVVEVDESCPDKDLAAVLSMPIQIVGYQVPSSGVRGIAVCGGCQLPIGQFHCLRPCGHPVCKRCAAILRSCPYSFCSRDISSTIVFPTAFLCRKPHCRLIFPQEKELRKHERDAHHAS